MLERADCLARLFDWARDPQTSPVALPSRRTQANAQSAPLKMGCALTPELQQWPSGGCRGGCPSRFSGRCTRQRWPAGRAGQASGLQTRAHGRPKSHPPLRLDPTLAPRASRSNSYRFITAALWHMSHTNTVSLAIMAMAVANFGCTGRLAHLVASWPGL